MQCLFNGTLRIWRLNFTTLTHLPQCCIYASVSLVSIGSDNGLPPGRRQAIIWTNADILSIGPQGTYFNEILFEIQIFSFKKMRLNMSSAKWWPFCPGGYELRQHKPMINEPPDPMPVAHNTVIYVYTEKNQIKMGMYGKDCKEKHVLKREDGFSHISQSCWLIL